MSSRPKSNANGHWGPELPANRAPRVLILGDPGKETVAPMVARLQAWLQGKAAEVLVDLGMGYDPIESKPDLIVSLGGDGMILAASHRMGKRRVPVIGVNLGRVGFLAGVSTDRLEDAMKLVFAGKARIEDRAMMTFQVKRGGETVLDSHVLNEILVSRLSERTMITIDLIDERRPVCTFRGDGVIVSTATGSTAYNLSAGGPILVPSLEALVVQPLAPHTLAMRPLVLRNDRHFTLHVQDSGQLTSDGYLEGKLEAGDRIKIGPSPRRLTLVVDPNSRFYDRLRSKLHWGETPGA
ncbi:MAG: NAD(+)/NADH kinase [Planctomycetota bacterium]|nr:NAD(+)/NADH kinase [Planctomycetota bacterium]MDA1114118.1 NAD(+)/NADH kinase [Planctomycetota bacterium]